MFRPANRLMDIDQNLAFVTDDNAINVKVATALMQRRGWRIEAFEGAAPMLDRLQSVRPAVILLDISMPDIGGEEACARIRSNPECKDVRIVAYTAHAMNEDIDRFLADGFDAVLIKPVTVAALTQTIGSPGSH